MINEEKDRRDRLQKLIDAGVNPYPAQSTKTHSSEEFMDSFDDLLKSQKETTLSGRAKTIRKHGGLAFVNLLDDGSEVQLVLRKDNMGEEKYNFFHETSDMGDFFEATGVAYVTKKGQNSLDVTDIKILTKTLLPLPEKFHGLTDIEMRYRKRYLDLIANQDVRKKFETRAIILKTMRDYLDKNGFLEVETPILQAIPGGANAKPFKTHHNALDTEMYLRIAPELHLKRCVVGGLDRVYEVARCFRNEGIDHAHNPEFTQIEGYAAYMDYEELMTFFENMLTEVIEAVGLDVKAVPFQGHTLDFSTPLPRKTFNELMLEHAKMKVEDYESREEVAKFAMENKIQVDKTDSKTTLLDNIYKHFVRPNIIQPIYLIDHPVEMTPLAKRKESDPRHAEMFQLLYGGGVENVKAFSELNDPIDQEGRFNEQDEARESGDEEAQFSDHDFVDALKHGMPPTAGFGVGIDRLTATLTDSHSLKEVILFPTLKPEKHDSQE
jgi:lysyl-tRNA synthetase, class II